MKKDNVLKVSRNLILTFCATTALVTVSNAQQGGKGGPGGTPPKEAIEICVGQDEGSQCTMNTPRGELSGTCQNTPDKKYFVCMPEGGPDGQKR